jgi:hypothetical protein
MLAVLAGCSSSSTPSVNQTPLPTTPTIAPTPPPTEPETTTTVPTVAHVGDSIALPATSTPVPIPALTITLVKVVDPAQPGQYVSVDPGMRLVGVQLRILDTDTTPYRSSIGNEVTIGDTQGQAYSPAFKTLSGCQTFPEGLVIAPNEPVLGCVSFQVPTANTIDAVHFTPFAGNGPTTAEWQVP